MKRFINALLLAMLFSVVANSVSAQIYTGPRLPWPLIDQTDDSPRRSLWSTFGEFQSYSGDPYLHTGIDIRGNAGDKVRVVSSGNIWMVGNYDDCKDDNSAPNCRVYVKGDDGYIYYYSHLQMGANTNLSQEAREHLEESADAATETDGDFTADTSKTRVTQNSYIFEIHQFDSVGGGWSHLHFGVVDSANNYNGINPLDMLDRSGDSPVLADEEDPRFLTADVPPSDFVSSPDAFQPLMYLEDGTANIVEPTGVCNEVNGALDIAARIEDTFITNSSVAPLDDLQGERTTGLYDVAYFIRNAETGDTTGVLTWYKFEQAPLFCSGNPGVASYSCDSVDEADFIDHITSNDRYALRVGEGYSEYLYSDELSCTWWGGGTHCTHGPSGQTVYSETLTHIVTNKWGEDGAWNTNDGAFPDGRYQVTVVAKDVDGNAASYSDFVFVNNNGTPYTNSKPDIYIRDRPGEIGEVPSNPAGEPFWHSPDILVVLKDTPVDENFNTVSRQVEAGVEYDVWLRVTNSSCTTAHNLKGRIYSANPAMQFLDSDWLAVDGNDGYHNPGTTVNVGPGERGLIGPFSWIPTVAEATENEGHRCLLAFVTSDEDEPVSDSPENVPADNNLAQLNLQVGNGDTSFYILNLQTVAADVSVQFDCGNFPVYEPGAEVEMRVEYDAAIESAWSGTSGIHMEHDNSTNQLVISFLMCNVDLPDVMLPANAKRLASVKLTPAGSSPPGMFSVYISQTVDQVLTGGMTFSVAVIEIE